MDNNNKNKKHTIVTLSPDTTGKGNEGDTKNKKCKSDDSNAHGKISSESLNNEEAAILRGVLHPKMYIIFM